MGKAKNISNAKKLGKRGGITTLKKHGRDHYKKMVQKRWSQQRKTKFNKKPFVFEGLFTLDMANNHMGSFSHGKKIIKEFGKVVKKHGVRASVKFQYRHYDTYVHPDYFGDKPKENATVTRFLSTRLSEKEFKDLVKESKKYGLITMSTPFDEESVNFIERLNLDIVKVASCSAKDWPLLQRIAESGKPVIVSTGGLSLFDIDNLVSFLQHRYVDFALMHCVGMYPTPIDKLQLNQIKLFKKRYPDVIVGFSTHEDPDRMDIIKMAYAEGARLFERHIGVATSKIKLNAYSSTTKQIDKWLEAYKEAILACGSETRPQSDPKEVSDLRRFMRGVFVKRNIKKGEVIHDADVFYAIPVAEKQIVAGEFMSPMVADRNYSKNDGISEKVKGNHVKSPKEIIYETIHNVKGMLNEAHVLATPDSDVELSHHYGIENFAETGATIIDCINRKYCKKIIVQLPGQSHPNHHHKKKEEAFHVLVGEMHIKLDGKHKVLYPGDVQIVKRGVKHSFWTDTGIIFEEVSTTHFNNDSIYADPKVNKMKRDERKTKLINWGRHQFD